MRIQSVLYLVTVLMIIILKSVKSSFCSRSDQSFARALTRKKRFILFPPNAAILVTPSLIKGLLSQFPRGYVISYEIDMYFSLPSKLEDYHPKIIKNKEKTMKPTVPQVKLEPQFAPSFHPQSDSLHWPSSFEGNSVEWLPEELSMPLRRNDIRTSSALHSNWTSNPRQRVWQTHPLYKQVVPWSSHRKSFWSNSPQIQSNFIGSRNRLIRNMDKEPISGTHKERRSIYNTLEGVGETIGFNVRACILRAICEAKHFLLPPGKSLIQDVIRILFTIPDTQEMDDDYIKSGRIPSSKDCKTIYSKECPISFISLALHREVLL